MLEIESIEKKLRQKGSINPFYATDLLRHSLKTSNLFLLNLSR